MTETDIVIETGEPTVVVLQDETFVQAPVQKAIQFTRLMAADSGDQIISGVKFKPRLINFRVTIDGGTYASWGHASVDDQACFEVNVLSGFGTSSTLAGIAHSSSGNYQAFTVTEFNPDGFTITWAKVGNPTGTAVIQAECYR